MDARRAFADGTPGLLDATRSTHRRPRLQAGFSPLTSPQRPTTRRAWTSLRVQAPADQYSTDRGPTPGSLPLAKSEVRTEGLALCCYEVRRAWTSLQSRPGGTQSSTDRGPTPGSRLHREQRCERRDLSVPTKSAARGRVFESRPGGRSPHGQRTDAWLSVTPRAEVRTEGLEPSRQLRRQNLNLVRLPIPPRSLAGRHVYSAAYGSSSRSRPSRPLT